MPELAEVEHARRHLARTCLGRTVLDARCEDDERVVEGSPRAVEEALRGAAVAGTGRRGKHLWLVLRGRPALLLHLGMTGAVRTRQDEPLRLAASPKEPDRSWPPRFTRLLFTLDDGAQVAFTNARRLGRIRLRDDPEGSPPISELGLDPLLDPPGPGELGPLLEGRRGRIKGLLLDQRVFAGVGNWIADEVLYQARIDPHRRACDLRPEEAEALRGALSEVVRIAVDADARKNAFPSGWLFHRRWGRKAGQETEDGHPIEHSTVAGRSTAWVPALQR